MNNIWDWIRKKIIAEYIPKTYVDFEMPDEPKLWIDEARRQSDQVISYNGDLEDKTRWLIRTFLIIIGFIISLWTYQGFPSKNWILAAIVTSTFIGLFFFWIAARTTNTEVLNVYEELVQLSDDPAKNEIQHKRIIIGLDTIVHQLKHSNSEKETWHERILIYIIIMSFVLILSLIII